MIHVLRSSVLSLIDLLKGQKEWLARVYSKKV
nr:MAG TPA: hypothetical protein [Caudoviricetes sp.]